MSKKLNRTIVGILSFVVVATGIGMKVQASSNSNSEKVARVSSVWVFTGDSEEDILDHTQYSQTAPEPTTCGTGTTLPCTVTFPAEITDDAALEGYLEAPGRQTNDVIAMSNALRD